MSTSNESTLRAERDQWLTAHRAVNTVLTRVLREREHLLEVIEMTLARLSAEVATAPAPPPLATGDTGSGYALVDRETMLGVIRDLARTHGHHRPVGVDRAAVTPQESGVCDAHEREVR